MCGASKPGVQVKHPKLDHDIWINNQSTCLIRSDCYDRIRVSKMIRVIRNVSSVDAKYDANNNKSVFIVIYVNDYGLSPFVLFPFGYWNTACVSCLSLKSLLYILFSSTPSYVKRVSFICNVNRIQGGNMDQDIRIVLEVKLGEARSFLGLV